MIQKENNREIKYKDTEVGRIPEHWDVVRLGDVCEIIMGQSPKSEHYNLEGEGLPFLQGNRTFKRKYAAYDTFSSIYSRSAPKDSILMSVRAPVGAVNMVNTEIAIGRGLCAINCKEECNEYIYYSLICNKERILSKQTGTVYGSINKNDVHNLLIPYPPLIERKKTAKILSDIDNKIETNNKISQTLETMAQTLFNEWFVEFNFPDANGNPYKKSGGKMVDSELGEIPEGWRVEQLEEHIKFVKGKKPTLILEKKEEGMLPYLTLEALSEKNTTYATVEKTIIVNELDILMVMDGASSGRVHYGKKGILGSTLAKIEKTSEIDQEYLYWFIESYQSEICENLTGSAIPHANKGYIFNLNLVVPDEGDTNIYRKLQVIRDKKIQLSNENDILKKHKDNIMGMFFS